MNSITRRGSWIAMAGVRSVVALVALAGSGTTVRGEEVQPHKVSAPSHSMCGGALSAASGWELEGVQIETGDIRLYELFFSQVLHADEVQRIDRPQVDFIRGYCYRNLLIVVRQDLKTPRPTGWVQVNFAVGDVGEVQQQVEHVLRESDVATLEETERTKVVRLRFKPDVPRSHCRVDRLEVNGPEGFMIGFDQFKEGSCKNPDSTSQKENRDHNRPHH